MKGKVFAAASWYRINAPGPLEGMVGRFIGDVRITDDGVTLLVLDFIAPKPTRDGEGRFIGETLEIAANLLTFFADNPG